MGYLEMEGDSGNIQFAHLVALECTSWETGKDKVNVILIQASHVNKGGRAVICARLVSLNTSADTRQQLHQQRCFTLRT